MTKIREFTDGDDEFTGNRKRCNKTEETKVAKQRPQNEGNETVSSILW